MNEQVQVTKNNLIVYIVNRLAIYQIPIDLIVAIVNISMMGINGLQPPNYSGNLVDNYKARKLKEYNLLDPEISKQPYLIIDNNLELIEQFQELLQRILALSLEGLGTDSLETKNIALQNIKDKIIELYDLD
ncbi:MAG: hypothetical protein HeimC2_32720 [Candidatus Heimdallarchaeota archaeon LC_2]|nr:MAG: hypothetical protein HeimC2_32720 [Candidatus Heimdallarchaeota archaeon LC_2]